MALAQAAGLPAHAIDTLIATPSPGDAPVHATPESPALLVYTSGTTGRPKGAVHTQANLLANMVAASEAQVLTAADQVLTVLPLFHVGGLCIQTLPALYVGAAVLLHARFDAGATLDAINRDRPTLTLQVPAPAPCRRPWWTPSWRVVCRCATSMAPQRPGRSPSPLPPRTLPATRAPAAGRRAGWR